MHSGLPMVSISTWFWIKTRELCTDHGKLAGSVKLLNYIVQASGKIPRGWSNIRLNVKRGKTKTCPPDTVGETDRENSIETYTTICKTDSQWEIAV